GTERPGAGRDIHVDRAGACGGIARRSGRGRSAAGGAPASARREQRHGRSQTCEHPRCVHASIVRDDREVAYRVTPSDVTYFVSSACSGPLYAFSYLSSFALSTDESSAPVTRLTWYCARTAAKSASGSLGWRVRKLSRIGSASPNAA